MRIFNYLSLLLCISFGLSGSNWTEFSFILKPSALGGIGVFAAHDILAGTLVLIRKPKVRVLKIKDIPEEFVKYCVYLNDEECLCPMRFDHMEIGWYLNHSDDPNIQIQEKMTAELNDFSTNNIYTVKDVKAGDEILINYNYFNEPEHLKEDYYK